jgi:transcriptional regulator with XRE-family HTH domain
VPTSADLGQAIRRLRRDRSLTNETLAFDAGIHPTYLSGTECGLRNPTSDRITSIARAFDVPASAIVRAAEQEAEIALTVRDVRARITNEHH